MRLVKELSRAARTRTAHSSSATFFRRRHSAAADDVARSRVGRVRDPRRGKSARTIRPYLASLAAEPRSEARGFVSEETYRVWRLYLAGSSHCFRCGQLASGSK